VKDHPKLLAGVYALVVEDHRDSRELLEETLSYLGAVVIAVASATEALRAVSRVTPNIVIADIAMPYHDGVWLLRELRHHQDITGHYVPVIALTASVGRPLRTDFDEVLIKPCSVDKLCEVILRLTDLGGQRGAHRG
jgi:CheY-like chemotaxis protein